MIITYRPYRTSIWFITPALIMSVISYLIAGYSLSRDYRIFLFFLTVGAVSLLCTKALYDASKTTFYLDSEGIRIVGGKQISHSYSRWSQLPYLYRGKSFKGHRFLLLSPKHMSQKEISQTANESASSYKVCVGSVIVIYLDATQDISLMQELIERKTEGQ